MSSHSHLDERISFSSPHSPFDRIIEKKHAKQLYINKIN
jgi:hypothetical protein